MSKVRRIDYYPDEFLVGTMSMACELKGAYWSICSLIYSSGGPIPDDAAWIAKVCGLSTRRWPAVREALLASGKITVTADGRLANGRCLKELGSAQRRMEAAAENGRKGGRPTIGSQAEVSLNSTSSAGSSAVQQGLQHEMNESSTGLDAKFYEGDLREINDLAKTTGLSEKKAICTITINNNIP